MYTANNHSGVILVTCVQRTSRVYLLQVCSGEMFLTRITNNEWRIKVHFVPIKMLIKKRMWPFYKYTSISTMNTKSPWVKQTRDETVWPNKC